MYVCMWGWVGGGSILVGEGRVWVGRGRREYREEGDGEGKAEGRGNMSEGWGREPADDTVA